MLVHINKLLYNEMWVVEEWFELFCRDFVLLKRLQEQLEVLTSYKIIGLILQPLLFLYKYIYIYIYINNLNNKY